jgi:hypothetical protein
VEDPSSLKKSSERGAVKQPFIEVEMNQGEDLGEAKDQN